MRQNNCCAHKTATALPLSQNRVRSPNPPGIHLATCSPAPAGSRVLSACSCHSWRGSPQDTKKALEVAVLHPSWLRAKKLSGLSKKKSCWASWFSAYVSSGNATWTCEVDSLETCLPDSLPPCKDASLYQLFIKHKIKKYWRKVYVPSEFACLFLKYQQPNKKYCVSLPQAWLCVYHHGCSTVTKKYLCTNHLIWQNMREFHGHKDLIITRREEMAEKANNWAEKQRGRERNRAEIPIFLKVRRVSGCSVILSSA